VDSIDGLSPAISIEQKTTSRSPRSTVGTITEIYDYLRLLYSSIGVAALPAVRHAEISRGNDGADPRAGAGDAGRISGDDPGADRARPQGRVQERAGEASRAGFVRARIDGEPPIARRRDPTRQAEEPHDRSRGGPAGAEAGIEKRLEASVRRRPSWPMGWCWSRW
jgi:excinuclease ABC subunit A